MSQSELSVRADKKSSLLHLHFVMKDDVTSTTWIFLSCKTLPSAALEMRKLSWQFAGLPILQFQCYCVFLSCMPVTPRGHWLIDLISSFCWAINTPQNIMGFFVLITSVMKMYHSCSLLQWALNRVGWRGHACLFIHDCVYVCEGNDCMQVKIRDALLIPTLPSAPLDSNLQTLCDGVKDRVVPVSQAWRA